MSLAIALDYFSFTRQDCISERAVLVAIDGTVEMAILLNRVIGSGGCRCKPDNSFSSQSLGPCSSQKANGQPLPGPLGQPNQGFGLEEVATAMQCDAGFWWHSSVLASTKAK